MGRGNRDRPQNHLDSSKNGTRQRSGTGCNRKAGPNSLGARGMLGSQAGNKGGPAKGCGCPRDPPEVAAGPRCPPVPYSGMEMAKKHGAEATCRLPTALAAQSGDRGWGEAAGAAPARRGQPPAPQRRDGEEETPSPPGARHDPNTPPPGSPRLSRQKWGARLPNWGHAAAPQESFRLPGHGTGPLRCHRHVRHQLRSLSSHLRPPAFLASCPHTAANSFEPGPAGRARGPHRHPPQKPGGR